MYLIGDDLTGHLFLQKLKAAALRGVAVFLLIDAYASSWIKGKTELELVKAGIVVKRFSRFSRFKSFYIGRRLHNKLIFIDHVQMSIGGINIADRYSGKAGGGAWLDYAVWIHLDAVRYFEAEASILWNRKTRKLLGISGHKAMLRADHKVRFLQNDWLRGKRQISFAYHEAIRNCQREALVLAAYFLPSVKMLRAFKQKAVDGVTVRLLLSGVSDVWMMRSAMKYEYPDLISAGVQIYERANGIVHGKVAVMDERVLIGSYNLNALSDFASIESNVEIIDAAFAGEVKRQLSKQQQEEMRLVEQLNMGLVNRVFCFFSWWVLRLATKFLLLKPIRKVN